MPADLLELPIAQVASSAERESVGAPAQKSSAPRAALGPRQDPWFVRWGLTLAAVAIIGVLIVVPVVNVFVQAFADGPRAYWNYLVGDPATRNAIFLTLMV